jgi:hypothetical protein
MPISPNIHDGKHPRFKIQRVIDGKLTSALHAAPTQDAIVIVLPDWAKVSKGVMSRLAKAYQNLGWASVEADATGLVLTFKKP